MRPQHCLEYARTRIGTLIHHRYSNALTHGQENIYNVKKLARKGRKSKFLSLFYLIVTFNILFNWKEKRLEGRKQKEEMKEGGRKQEGREGRLGGSRKVGKKGKVHAMKLTQIDSLGIWSKIGHIYIEFI